MNALAKQHVACERLWPVVVAAECSTQKWLRLCELHIHMVQPTKADAPQKLAGCQSEQDSTR